MIENQDLQEQIDKEEDILSAIDVAKYLYKTITYFTKVLTWG